MTSTEAELAVIGAGPAGLAAALAAADLGVRVVVLDSAPEAGGQFYRQPARELRARQPQRLFHDWSTWRRLSGGFEAHSASGRITFLPNRHVWNVEDGDGPDRFIIHALVGNERLPRGAPHDESEVVVARALILATGAYERVLPFPGWTLPGVVAAGGAQAMLKAGLVLPGRRIVVAGSGPLLLPVAASLAAAGAEIAGCFEATRPSTLVRNAASFAGHPGKLIEGAGYATDLMHHQIRMTYGTTVVRAHSSDGSGSGNSGDSSSDSSGGNDGGAGDRIYGGGDRVKAVTIAKIDRTGRVIKGSERRIACDALAVSHGLLPRNEIAYTLGTQAAVDAEQRTDVPWLWAAGEATGIGGAALAIAEGEVAGRSAAAHLRAELDGGAFAVLERRSGRAIRHRRALRRAREFAELIDRCYRPAAGWTEQVTDSTVLCRCEEVTAGAVREAVRTLGATDLRSVKLLTRAGMGWCQGRMCGSGVAGVVTYAGGPSPLPQPFATPTPSSSLSSSSSLSPSPFAEPVPLGVLASGSGSDADAISGPDPDPDLDPDPGSATGAGNHGTHSSAAASVFTATAPPAKDDDEGPYA